MTKPTWWNDVLYASSKAAARALKVTPSTMRYRRKMGYVRDSDLKLRRGSLKSKRQREERLRTRWQAIMRGKG